MLGQQSPCLTVRNIFWTQMLKKSVHANLFVAKFLLKLDTGSFFFPSFAFGCPKIYRGCQKLIESLGICKLLLHSVEVISKYKVPVSLGNFNFVFCLRIPCLEEHLWLSDLFKVCVCNVIISRFCFWWKVVMILSVRNSLSVNSKKSSGIFLFVSYNALFTVVLYHSTAILIISTIFPLSVSSNITSVDSNSWRFHRYIFSFRFRHSLFCSN